MNVAGRLDFYSPAFISVIPRSPFSATAFLQAAKRFADEILGDERSHGVAAHIRIRPTPEFD